MSDTTIAPGGVPTPPFAFLPDPVADFTRRADRLSQLAAQGGNLASWLSFLAGLAKAQARLAAQLPSPPPLDAGRLRHAKTGRMPPLDRAVLADGPAADAALSALTALLDELPMPAPARAALDALAAAPAQQRREVLRNAVLGTVPDDAIAAHLFATAATQVVLALQAAQLRPDDLQPIETGICPTCGSRPAVSVVSATLETLEGTRYACCASCGTRWNEVRVKCLCCGSMKAISYRALEHEGEAPPAKVKDEPAIKAECCGDCGQWVKIFYQLRLPQLEPLADDAASLSLDLRMAGGRWARGGWNPWLAGYR